MDANQHSLAVKKSFRLGSGLGLAKPPPQDPGEREKTEKPIAGRAAAAARWCWRGNIDRVGAARHRAVGEAWFVGDGLERDISTDGEWTGIKRAGGLGWRAA